MSETKLSFDQFKEEVLKDYKLAQLSRQMSLLGRREVLMRRVKYRTFGDGKELVQIALAKQFRADDWRLDGCGDQTFQLAIGALTPKSFFSALFNPHSVYQGSVSTKAGSGLPGTSSSESRLLQSLGLALASKIYKKNFDVTEHQGLDNRAHQVAFTTVYANSVSEGYLLETLSAASSAQIPLSVSLCDEGRNSPLSEKKSPHLSQLLDSFKKSARRVSGLTIYRVKGWDYPSLCQVYSEGVAQCREGHHPVLFYLDELTQPLGYAAGLFKSKEQLDWEKGLDCIFKMRNWVLETEIASDDELKVLEKEAAVEAKVARDEAFAEYVAPLHQERDELIRLISSSLSFCDDSCREAVDDIIFRLKNERALNRSAILSAAQKVLHYVYSVNSSNQALKESLKVWIKSYHASNFEEASCTTYHDSSCSALRATHVAPQYAEEPLMVHGRRVLFDNFEQILNNHPHVLLFGTEVGHLASGSKTLDELQAKYGALRLLEKGDRAVSAVGAGIGLALRGFRPIVVLQPDALLTTLPLLKNDVATLYCLTKGRQKMPLIVSVRGQQLGHDGCAGSPLGMALSSLRGIYVCVPRNMVQAAGFYNQLLKDDHPGMVFESFNAYYLREPQPLNVGDYTTPLGVSEVLRQGSDVTLVTYGWCVDVAIEAVELLSYSGLSVELIDVQTLLPFDVNHSIAKSVKKTGRVIFFDDDVLGGTTAFMVQQVIEKQKAFQHLSAPVVTISAALSNCDLVMDGSYLASLILKRMKPDG